MCAWEPFFRPCAKAMRNAHFPQCLRSALIPTHYFIQFQVLQLKQQCRSLEDELGSVKSEIDLDCGKTSQEQV